MSVTVATYITNLLPALNTPSTADLVWWTAAELYEWADEAVARLARLTGGFTERSTATSTAANAPHYAVPARTIATLHVSLNGSSLRAVNRQELDALDASWRTATSDTPSKYARDVIGLNLITLYKIPTLVQVLGVVYRTYPDTITAASVLSNAPAAVGDYIAYDVLARARAKESDAAMPEVAKHAMERAALYAKIFTGYYGGAR